MGGISNLNDTSKFHLHGGSLTDRESRAYDQFRILENITAKSLTDI